MIMSVVDRVWGLFTWTRLEQYLHDLFAVDRCESDGSVVGHRNRKDPAVSVLRCLSDSLRRISYFDDK